MNLMNLKNYLNGCISDGVPSGMSNTSILELVDQLEAAKLDAARIEFVQDATVDIRCVEQGEDSYGWQVIEHHMGTPREKVIGGSFDELGLREAIDAAMAATKGEEA